MNTVAELLLQDQRAYKASEPAPQQIDAYRWDVQARTGGKPGQVWVSHSLELNPAKQRVMLRANALMTADQAQEIGQVLVKLAGEINPFCGEAKVYKTHLQGRTWTPSWPHQIQVATVRNGSYPISLRGDYDLHPKTAWEIGSHLIQLAQQSRA